MCSGDTAAAQKLPEIFLEYDTIFDKSYARIIVEVYARTASAPFTKVTSFHYEILHKKDTTWKMDFSNLSDSSSMFVTRLTVSIY